jgi:elongation factor G
VDSSEVAFENAAETAFKNACEKAKLHLLEPIMSLEVETPEEYLGTIIKDLNARRATIKNMDQRGTVTIVSAEAPLSELFGYATVSRSMSQGRASYTMRPFKFQQAPRSMVEKTLGFMPGHLAGG